MSKAFVKILKNVKSVKTLGDHLKYIGFRSRETRGDTLGFFNQTEDKANWKSFVDSVANEKAFTHDRTVKAHKIILSLRNEDYQAYLASGRDYKDLTRQVMADFQAQKGVRAEWIAALHEKEGHPHVHIVLKAAGKDSDNSTKRIKITKDDINYLKERFDVEHGRHALYREPLIGRDEYRLAGAVVERVFMEMKREAQRAQQEKEIADRKSKDR